MPTAADPFALHWSLYPRHFVAPKTLQPLIIDGNILDKPAWKAVPFSAPFDEIRGAEDAPPGTRPSRQCQTRMKMLWDDEYLYIAALVESDFTVTANFTHRNEPIFQKDSDFEVFVNPSGSCHDYKELELNAINTVWNLMLNKPYDDGGIEHSGRIAKPGDSHYYEVYHQRTATKVVSGKVGDPKGATWAVEIALAHSDTLASDPHGTVPTMGQRWRINFSRVEHQGEINWTWQPQRIWDPIKRRIMGKVAMHLPDAWGYVEFGPPHLSTDTTDDEVMVGDVSRHLLANKERKRRDPTWPARLAVMNVYYAQRQYQQSHPKGHYAANLEELKELVDHDILQPFLTQKDGSNHISIELSDNRKSYRAIVIDSYQNIQATVRDDRLLLVHGIPAPANDG